MLPWSISGVTDLKLTQKLKCLHNPAFYGEYVSAPGKLSPYFPPIPPIFRIFGPRVGDTLLFENGYFDVDDGDMVYLCFHPFSHIFCSFPPHPFLFRVIFTYPHYGDPEKAGVM